MATKKEAMAKASANALNSMFTQSTETTQISTEKEITVKSTPKEEKDAKKANKRVTKVFSFRSDVESVAQFRAYCFAKYGMTVDQVGEMALKEYIQNNPLEKFERDLYKTRLAEELAKLDK